MADGDGNIFGRDGGNFFRATLHLGIMLGALRQNVCANARHIRQARGQLAVDVREAAVVEEGTRPREDRLGFLFFRCTGKFRDACIEDFVKFFQRADQMVVVRMQVFIGAWIG